MVVQRWLLCYAVTDLSLSSRRCDVPSFLITWSPKGWPHSELMKLVRTQAAGHRATTEWRFRAYRQAHVGDTVFLLKQGAGPKGIFGVGTIVDSPYRYEDKEGEHHSVAPIEFQELVDPLKRLLIGEEVIRRILPDTKINTQASGIAIDQRVGQALAALFQSRKAQQIIDGPEVSDDEIDYANPPYNPSAESFVNFLRAANISSKARDILLAHYSAPDHIARTSEIAHALSIDMLVVNSIYGRLGKRAVNFLGIDLPSGAIPSHVFSSFNSEHGHWSSCMHDSVAKAIELVGWDNEARQRFGNFFSEQLDQEAATQAYFEGRLIEARLIARSRNGLARQACIDRHGTSCAVCGFDFGVVYGGHGAGFIEVHHLIRVSSHDEEHQIDSVKDLCPVCANCHRMLHRSNKPLSVEQLKSIIAKTAKAAESR
jgi:hypothetical protein